MNSSFPNSWSFSYLEFTKYVTYIIVEPKYKYRQQEQAAGMVIKEFIGLRSKMYSYEINNKTTKKCNRISKHTVKKDITIDDYRNTLFSSTEKNAHYEIK